MKQISGISYIQVETVLGRDLFTEMRGLLRARLGQDNHVERDIARYAKYLSACEGTDVTVDSVDYEK